MVSYTLFSCPEKAKSGALQDKQSRVGVWLLFCVAYSCRMTQEALGKSNFMSGYSSTPPIPPHVTGVCLCPSILTGSCPSLNFPTCTEGSALVGMQGVELGTAEPCWNSQPELSPGCRADFLSPHLLMPGGGSSVTLRGKRVEQHCHPTPPTSPLESDTSTDVFALTVFHLCSFSLAGQLPLCCRAGIPREAAPQPSCGCPLPLSPHCWAARQCGSRLFQDV